MKASTTFTKSKGLFRLKASKRYKILNYMMKKASSTKISQYLQILSTI